MNQEKHLHIISLTVPYPVDYGGVFDLFHKLPALQREGVKVHLHCFDYGRGPQPELERYCASVHYYPRHQRQVFSKLPYIVASRKDEQLFRNLLKDDYPILMEGIHCAALLVDQRFKGRKCFVRLHNIESDYYTDLARYTHSPLRKLFHRREARLLKKFERAIAGKAVFLAVTKRDAEVFATRFRAKSEHLPLFLPEWQVNGAPGMGTYCLYQGDLSVASNQRIATWLVTKIFAGKQISLRIAGKNPPKALLQLVRPHENVSLIANPSSSQMQELIRDAHINILPSLSATGIKLKLLNALFNGRHCLVNTATVSGTGLEQFCHIAENGEHLIDMIAQLYHQPFTTDELQGRKQQLEQMFNNTATAKKLIETIWPNG